MGSEADGCGIAVGSRAESFLGVVSESLFMISRGWMGNNSTLVIKTCQSFADRPKHLIQTRL